MISMGSLQHRALRRRRAASGLLVLQFLLPALMAIAGPAFAVPVETQDSQSELITSRLHFDGTDGSTYNSTVVGAAGAELGTVLRNLTRGFGYWGEGATLDHVRMAYPGNLTLAGNGSINEVFFSRGGTGPRDRLANGSVSWTAGTPTESIWTAAFDQDGDGWLDDAVLASTGTVNRYYLYNQAGTQLGTRAPAPNNNYLLDIAAVDTDSNGALDQVALGHEGGLIYVERAPATNVWSVNVPGNIPVWFVAAIDLNGDGRLEGVLAGADDRAVGAGDRNVYAYGSTGVQRWAYNTGGTHLVNLTGIEANGSHRLDGALVAAEDAITVLTATGAVVWNWTTNATVTAAARLDVNRDGIWEGAVYADDAGGISILDGSGSLVAWTTGLSTPIRAIESVDLDADGWLNEVISANLTNIAGLDATGALLWTGNVTAPFTVNMVTHADFEGNGTFGDTIVAANDSVYVFNRTGALRWNSNENRDIRYAAFLENPSAAANGSYLSEEFDVSTQAGWSDFSFGAGVNHSNETVTGWIRFGTGTAGNVSWGSWQGGFGSSPVNLSGNASRFAQVRFDFASADGRNAANLSFFRLNFTTAALSGFLVTPPFTAGPAAAWLDLDAQFNLSGGAVRFLYSADAGSSWRAFTPPAAVDAANVTAASIVVRIEMDVGAASPNVAWVSVRYAQPGLRPVIATPAVNASLTGVVNVSAIADPQITAVSFSFRNLSNNATGPIGPGAFDGATSRWYALWDTAGQNASAFTVLATGVDARGFSFTGALSPVLVDNAPPALAFAVPAAGAVLSGTVPIRLSASSDTASVTIAYVGNVTTYPVGAATETSPGVWEISWDTVAAGVVEEGGLLSATAVDRVGLSTTVEQRFLFVDNLTPWVRIDAPTAGSKVEGIVQVNISAAPDVTSVEIIQNGSEGFALQQPGNATESRWTFQWSTFPDISNPSASLVAIATDRAGHVATDSVSNLEIDNTAPVPVLIEPTLPGAYRGVVRLLVAAPGANAYLLLAWKENGVEHNITNLSGSTQNATTGFYEYLWDTSGLDFVGSLVVRAAPEFGLVGERVFDGLTIDNSPPIVSFIRPESTEDRVNGTYVIEVFADLDTASVALSYTDLGTGQTVHVANLTHTPSTTRWRYTWAIGSLFVPYASLQAYAVDGVGLNRTAIRLPIIIGLNPEDSPPTIVRAPNAPILDEDFGTYEINISGLIIDDDPENVTVYIDGVDPSLVTLRNNGSKGTDSRLWLVSVPNKHIDQGTTLQMRVVDASGQTRTAPFQLYIHKVNDPPSWVDPHSTIFVEAGMPYDLDFSLYVHDVEFEDPVENGSLFIDTDDPLHISQLSPPERLTLRFDYPNDFAGRTVFVNYSLRDDGTNFVPQVFQGRVVVTNDAVPRLIKPLPDIILDEDTPKFNILDLHEYFTDPDGEPLFYYSGLNQSFGIRIEAGVLSIDRLPLNWNGETSVFLGANDTIGAFAESRVQIMVNPVNDAPQWDFSKGLGISNFFVHFGVPFLFDLGPYAFDVDSPRQSLIVFSSEPNEAHALISNASLNAAGEGLVLVLDFDVSYDGQNVVVVLYVTDGAANSTTLSVTVHVSDNYPPQSSQPLPPEIVMMEGEALSPALILSEYFTDPDGTLFFANGTLNVRVDIDQGTSELSLTSEGEWSGTETLIIRAIDNRLAFKDTYILITVMPVNDPPRFSCTADLTVEAGTLGKAFVMPCVSDPDTPLDRLTFTVESKYPNAFVAFTNGNITFVYPTSSDPSVVLPSFDTLRLCVSDGEKTKCGVYAVRIIQPTTTAFNWLQFFIFVSTAGVGAIVVARHFIEFKIKRPPTVEDIFLVYEDGILIKHISKNVRKYADEDVVTSMLSAIQSFAADSFEDKGHWELREVQFQGRKILLERARKFQIVLIFDGDANEDLKKAVLKAAQQIQAKYKEHLKDWDGDPSHFDGVDSIFRPLLALESAYIPGEVTADELVRAPFVPGEAYVSETADFGPLLKTYGKELEGLAVIRIRPGQEKGVPLDPWKPAEVQIIEVAAPEGAPEEDAGPETGLDVAVGALKDALEDAKVAVRGKAPVVLFEGFEWILDRYGFVFSKKFSDQLKKLASAEGFYLFVAVDGKALSPQQLEGLERGAVVFRGA